MLRKFLIYLTLLIVVVATCYQIFGLLYAGKKFFAAYVAGAIMAYAWQAAARLIAKLRAKEEV